MKTEQLYEFLVLSRTLNYSRAADALYISQSVLSKHILKMEQELNTSLFFRSTHNVSLTPAGHLLARKAESLLDKCNAAIHLARTGYLPDKGRVRIACAPEIACSPRLQAFVRYFAERYPDIYVHFEVKSEGTPESILENPAFDFVFTPCEYVNLPSCAHRFLLERHDTYAAFSSGHRLLSKPQIYLRELTGETILVPFAHELFGPYAKNWLLVQKYTHKTATCIQVPNLATALFLITVQKGVVIIPRHARTLASGEIYLSRIASEVCCFNEYAYYMGREESAAARLFFEELQLSFLPRKNGLSSD